MQRQQSVACSECDRARGRIGCNHLLLFSLLKRMKITRMTSSITMKDCLRETSQESGHLQQEPNPPRVPPSRADSPELNSTILGSASKSKLYPFLRAGECWDGAVE